MSSNKSFNDLGLYFQRGLWSDVGRAISVELGRDGAGVVRADLKVLTSLGGGSRSSFVHHFLGGLTLQGCSGDDARCKGIVDREMRN